MALKASPNYIPVEKLEADHIYLIRGRNSYLGIWQPPQNFVIIREKLGRTFLGIEYHWDTHSLHGTAKPFIKLAGLVAPDQRRPALEAAHALITYEEFMLRTASFI
jgi:hypothetical protein